MRLCRADLFPAASNDGHFKTSGVTMPALQKTRRIVVLAFATASMLIAAILLMLWVLTRPVLVAAATEYDERPICKNSGWFPPGYPQTLREVQSFESAHHRLLTETCRRHDLSCHHKSRNPLFGHGTGDRMGGLPSSLSQRVRSPRPLIEKRHAAGNDIEQVIPRPRSDETGQRTA